MKIKSVAQIEVDRMEANLKQDISNLKINLANAIRLGTKEGYEQKTREVLALLAKQRKEIENLPRTSLKEFAAYEAKLELLGALEAKNNGETRTA
jgi:flagellar biosynthesis/type III secretory pathway protein FliH